MQRRFPRHLIPLPAAVLAAAALLSTGSERVERVPLDVKGPLLLTDHFQRAPVVGVSPMQPFAWISPAVPTRSSLAVPVPGEKDWGGRFERDFTASPAMSQAQPVVEQSMRQQRRNGLLGEAEEGDGWDLPGMNVEQGWGWLAEELGSQEKADLQGAAARGRSQDGYRNSLSDPFASGSSDDSFGMGRERKFTLE